MKASHFISFATFALGTQALVAAPRDGIAAGIEVKREAEADAAPAPAPAAEQMYGICMIGVDSPCNGDAWDKNGKDGKTWENHHRFQIGKGKDLEDFHQRWNIGKSRNWKREAEAEAVPAPAPDAVPAPAPVADAKPDVGICMIGVDSPCNGDAWDKNGKDGKTWENHHRFQVGKEWDNRLRWNLGRGGWLP